MDDEKFFIDYRGHNLSGRGYVSSESMPKYRAADIQRTISWVDMANLPKIKATYPSKEYEAIVQGIGKHGQCALCNDDLYIEKAPKQNLDAPAYRFTTSCRYPKGRPAINIKLKVPSGRIVFTNDSRDLVDGDGDGFFDVNGVSGTIDCVRHYEKRGMVHFLVGNSCPSILKMPGGGVRIATHRNGGGGRRVGGICTDLWWVCAMDEDNYDRLVAEKKVDPGAEVRVKVTPGTWVFNYDPNRGCGFKFCDATLKG